MCTADKARRAAAKAASEEEAAGLARQWRNVERSLCSECGLWAAPHNPEEAAWKLDKHEDSLRRHALLAVLDVRVSWQAGMCNAEVSGCANFCPASLASQGGVQPQSSCARGQSQHKLSDMLHARLLADKSTPRRMALGEMWARAGA